MVGNLLEFHSCTVCCDSFILPLLDKHSQFWHTEIFTSTVGMSAKNLLHIPAVRGHSAEDSHLPGQQRGSGLPGTESGWCVIYSCAEPLPHTKGTPCQSYETFICKLHIVALPVLPHSEPVNCARSCIPGVVCCTDFSETETNENCCICRRGGAQTRNCSQRDADRALLPRVECHCRTTGSNEAGGSLNGLHVHAHAKTNNSELDLKRILAK